MANQTISWKAQRLDIFGPTPATTWNSSFNWSAAGTPGRGCWGMKSAGTGGSLPLYKNIFRTLNNSSMNVGISLPASSIWKNFAHILSKINTIVVSYSNSDKEIGSGNGYNYVFPGGSSNIESAVSASYASASAGSVSWTSASVATTTWS